MPVYFTGPSLIDIFLKKRYVASFAVPLFFGRQTAARAAGRPHRPRVGAAPDWRLPEKNIAHPSTTPGTNVEFLKTSAENVLHPTTSHTNVEILKTSAEKVHPSTTPDTNVEFLKTSAEKALPPKPRKHPSAIIRPQKCPNSRENRIPRTDTNKLPPRKTRGKRHGGRWEEFSFPEKIAFLPRRRESKMGHSTS